MISFTDVVKTYRRGVKPALDGVSFEVGAGEFVFVVGASGSGKSTLIRLLLAEEKVSSGELSALGWDVVRLPRRRVPQLRRQIGVVFQDYRLLPDRDVQANVAYVLHVLGYNPADVDRLVPETLDVVGVGSLARRLPHELSGGEQQRVALARALVKRPSLLLADEPTGNLDPEATESIVELLGRVNAEGTTVLMATHDDRVVDMAGRRVIELCDGVVVRDEVGGRYRVVASGEGHGGELL
ncbi:cell division ATP-binding protein FtsE [Dermatophilus congolensis]|uniref:cell division ATP-binding protein FtsE n=1 Tax=Dermatophilus congolensis TaxID=1863 RepID=UPI000E0E2FDB|nr:ATP-binding cassette domain-containing protein [Dermatophilus congolensis]MBO3142500.1 ATP-binding cassette domain-containing protein [Dermatophilus congolensis]MBO3151489.1 ATP-binding cassette domain-containing protein [Dermatophilus congolensis]MBO3161507.1 ATP-binding cassette domain-containing protein [Dermatophilus congolensis]MBO3162775.1 ATP-binding cassette domain-containing protein [Dermatophilus congolensis]MBO3176329.1 ATP-binding cassette domain-containing protein [Dermatophilu